jgi:hypothetical protein
MRQEHDAHADKLNDGLLPKNEITSLYLSPKVTNQERDLWCKNNENSSDRKISHLGNFN